MMFKFIVALPCEASPLIEHFKLKQTHHSPFAVYQNEKFALAICGVGGLNASACVMHLNHICSEEGHWINIGVAGHPEYETGKLLLVSKVSHPQIKKSFYPYPCIRLNMDRSPLISLDSPSQNYLDHTLYDMEGYGFTFSCSKLASLDQIHLFKVISDNAKTTLFSIQKEALSKSIECHLPQIKDYIHLLTCSEKISLKEIEIPSSYPIHFSQTQKHQLKRMLKILDLHKPGQHSLDTLEKFGSSKEILIHLEKELFEVSLLDL